MAHIVTAAGSGRRTNRQSPEKLQYKRFISQINRKQAGETQGDIHIDRPGQTEWEGTKYTQESN